MSLLTRLERTYEWMQDLSVAVTGADKPHISRARKNLQGELAMMGDELARHVDTLVDAAEELEIGEEYIEETEESAATVREILESIDRDDPEPLASDEQDELDDAVEDLEDRAAGLLEDVGARQSE